MPRVAVEQSLSHIADMLRSNGYEVVDLGNWQNQVDAVVVTGQDINLMNVSDRVTGAPVINAAGMTAQEVFREVNERLRPDGAHR